MANDTDLPYSEADGRDAGFEDRDPYGANASPARFGRLALCTAAAGALAFGVLGTVAYSVWFNHDQQAYAEAIATARQALGIRGPAAASVSGRQPPQAVMAAPAPAVPVADAPARATAAAMAGAPATMTPDGAATANALMNAASTEKTAAAQAGEEGGKHAVWSGQVARAPATTATTVTTATTATTATIASTLADATPAGNALPDTTFADNTHPAPATPPTPAPSPRRHNRRATNADPAAQPSTASRPAKDSRIAQQERNGSAPNATKHTSSLFARMGLFFRRVSYRQHDTGRQQQDVYSHP
ncbi:MAG TPA: hypothetical protein VGJ10_18210 [Paraburkholderia sp.]